MKSFFATTAIVASFASAVALSLSLAMPAAAQTPSECGNSFVILPDGGCLDLSHLGYLGHSRENLAVINQLYQAQYNLNLNQEIFYSQYPLFDNETEEERQARYASLARTASERDDTAASAQQIEDLLFPFQNRAMTVFGSAFSENRNE